MIYASARIQETSAGHAPPRRGIRRPQNLLALTRIYAAFNDHLDVLYAKSNQEQMA